MGHRRILIGIVVAALAALALGGGTLAVASPYAVAAKKHHKRHKHHKHHKKPKKPTKPTKPTYPAASSCSSGISAYGVVQGSPPNQYWDYTMGVGCQDGYWSQVQVTTSQPIETGTLTAGIGTTGAPLKVSGELGHLVLVPDHARQVDRFPVEPERRGEMAIGRESMHHQLERDADDRQPDLHHAPLDDTRKLRAALRTCAGSGDTDTDRPPARVSRETRNLSPSGGQRLK